MSKWKCDICNSEFNNYHAEGFNNKIYCPLCYYKHEYKDLQTENAKLKEENIVLKEKLVLIYENFDVSYNEYVEYKEVMEKLGE